MAQELMDIATGTAGNTISSAILVPIIQRLIQEIDDVLRFEKNREHLGEQLNRVKGLVLDIRALFRDQQRELPASLTNSLLMMQREVGKGRELIHRSERPWPEQVIGYLRFQPVPTQIREWNATINGLLNALSNDFLLICNAQQIMSAARQQEDVLLQDLPDTGLIGMEIRDAKRQLQSWVSEAPHVHIIGVYGMGGVGKTTLLKKVYNAYKEVSHSFDHVIWVRVSQFPDFFQMQNDIVSTINLDLANCTSADMRKMRLSAYMKTKKFFLVLDDLWTEVNFKELGVEFGTQKGSKVVFSTRNKDLIGEMNAEQYIQIRPLSQEEAWGLFSKVAFKDDPVPEHMEDIAREVADECKGLPLAINVIASTMRGNTELDVWKLALKQMQTVDLNFPLTHPRIDRDLYLRLRWSYDRLPADSNLRNCFLYSAIFMEDEEISVEPMVQMWIAEGFVKAKENLLETGRSYVKLFINRCLFEDVPGRTRAIISVHDVIRDMAIYIAERDENCVFRAGQSLQHFPDIPSSEKCKRISVRGNDIKSLPATELRCPKLVSLNLALNYQLREIHEAFFLNLISLRVLDLNGLPIKLLPTSLWQLTQLEYLDLGDTRIEDISGEIGNLSNLQFLHLTNCRYLKSLPCQIGELRNLKSLNICRCDRLSVIPDEITNLSGCEILGKDITGFRRMFY